MIEISEEIIEFTDYIGSVVSDKGPIKATELVVDLVQAQHTTHTQFKNADIVEMLDMAVKRGNIVEVSYVLPSMPFREKSMYFPKGTKIVMS